MAELLIDSASVHDAISGLSRRGALDWSDWEKRALYEVTLSLLFRPRVHIPPPPRRGPSGVTGLVDPVMEILRDFISEPSVTLQKKKAALQATKLWVERHADEIRSTFERSRSDPSLDPFVRWHVEWEWPYHVGRLGGLVDPQMEHEVRTILGWSQNDQKNVRSWGSDLRVVELWSGRFKATGQLPPQVLVDGWLVSALLRGRYYQEIARSVGGDFIWSPFRDYALEPVVTLTEFDDFKKDLTKPVLAGLICRGAMEERSERDAIVSWAENIRRFRTKPVRILPEDDLGKAEKKAVDVARRCDFQFQWQKLEVMLEGTVVHFLSSVVGIAAGLFALATSNSHSAPVVAHVGSEWIARPFIHDVAEKVYLGFTRSSFRLKGLAHSGARRLFALAKKDLQLP